MPEVLNEGMVKDAPIEINGVRYTPVRAPKDNSCFFHSIACGLSRIPAISRRFANGHELRDRYVFAVLELRRQNPVVRMLEDEGVEQLVEQRLLDVFEEGDDLDSWSRRMLKRDWYDHYSEWKDGGDVSVMSTIYNVEIVEHNQDETSEHCTFQLHQPPSSDHHGTSHLLKTH